MESLGDGKFLYAGTLSAANSGKHGFALRIIPGGELLDGIPVPGLIYWEQPGPLKKQPRVAPAETRG